MTGSGGGEAQGPQVQESDAELLVEIHHAGNAVVVAVQGELDTLTAPQLRSAVGGSMVDGQDLLVIDLTQLSFLGSSGLALLLEFRELAVERGVGFHLVVGDNRHVTRPVEITGLSSVLPLRRNLDDALQHHNAPGEEDRSTGVDRSR